MGALVVVLHTGHLPFPLPPLPLGLLPGFACGKYV